MSEATTDSAERQDDYRLIALMADQPTAAIAGLYDRYGRLVFSVALRIVGNREVAEEITQDVFVSCWRSAAQYRPSRGSVVTWLLSITHHRAIDELRSRQHRYRQNELAWEHAPAHVLASEEGLDLTLVQSQVREALAQLPADQREVVELLYFGGLSRQEAAERLHAPLGTVHTRLRLAMNKLRAMLRTEASDDADRSRGDAHES